MHASGTTFSVLAWLVAFGTLTLSNETAAAPASATAARDLVAQGVRYENAEGVERDYAKALELYCEGARMNDAEAFLRLGWMYANARGQARDDQVANTLFRKSAALGNEVAERLSKMVRGESHQDKIPACLEPRPPARSARFEPRAPWLDASGNLTPFATGARAEVARSVVRLARELHLDPRLVLAVIRAESNFDPMARSPKNAQGLMQLIPETAERFAVRNVYDPVDNLRGGMRYLRWLLSYFRGNVDLALAGYNAGEGAVDRARGVPPYAETRAYVQRIRALYPHEHHPYDESVTDPSPLLKKDVRQAALEVRGATRAR